VHSQGAAATCGYPGLLSTDYHRKRSISADEMY